MVWFVALGGLLAMASAAVAQPACGGKDLLPGLATTKPDVHAEVIAAARSEINVEALLWRITRAGEPAERAQPSWLFGTIHLTDARVTALTPAVRAGLEAATTLALEIDDVGPEAMRKAFADNPQLLAVPAESAPGQVRPFGDWAAGDRAALDAAAPKLGLPVAHAAALRPWFLTTLLSRPACEVARQEAGLQPLDMVLRERAIARGIAVAGLESIPAQMRAMAGLQPATEVAWLRASLRLYPDIDDLTETLVRLYLDRRIAGTWALSQRLAADAAMTPPQLAEIQEALVVRRNRAMRDAGRPLLAAGRVFIAVGALHLPGREGLVQLLRDDGFAVTAVE